MTVMNNLSTVENEKIFPIFRTSLICFLISLSHSTFTKTVLKTTHTLGSSLKAICNQKVSFPVRKSGPFGHDRFRFYFFTFRHSSRLLVAKNIHTVLLQWAVPRINRVMFPVPQSDRVAM